MPQALDPQFHLSDFRPQHPLPLPPLYSPCPLPCAPRPMPHALCSFFPTSEFRIPISCFLLSLSPSHLLTFSPSFLIPLPHAPRPMPFSPSSHLLTFCFIRRQSSVLIAQSFLSHFRIPNSAFLISSFLFLFSYYFHVFILKIVLFYYFWDVFL